MKKTIKTILASFLIGALLSLLVIFKFQKQLPFLEEKNIVTVFQIGVYKSIENAQKKQEEYNNSIIIKDNDYYRVFIGVAEDKTCEKLLENYYLTQNINVYPKEIEVTKKFLEEIKNYEKKISKEDVSLMEKMNAEMMKKLEGEIL